MPIKRRGFVKGLLLTPAAPAVLAAQQTSAQSTTPLQQPTPQPNTPARQIPRQPTAIAKLPVTEVDLAADTKPHFFTADQFAALQKLANIFMPPMKGNPGALDAKAPEFLDFLISVSPADRQKLYQSGLNHLNAQAKQKFHKPFAELEGTQADSLIRPLMVVRPWPQDLPTDPDKNFVAQVHEDLRTATTNSREWAQAARTSGRFTRGSRATGLYWAPIDPIDGD